jgi:hypothetical protein
LAGDAEAVADALAFAFAGAAAAGAPAAAAPAAGAAAAAADAADAVADAVADADGAPFDDMQSERKGRHATQQHERCQKKTMGFIVHETKMPLSLL